MIRFGQILTDDLQFRKTEAVAIKTRLSHRVPGSKNEVKRTSYALSFKKFPSIFNY